MALDNTKFLPTRRSNSYLKRSLNLQKREISFSMWEALNHRYQTSHLRCRDPSNKFLALRESRSGKFYLLKSIELHTLDEETLISISPDYPFFGAGSFHSFAPSKNYMVERSKEELKDLHYVAEIDRLENLRSSPFFENEFNLSWGNFLILPTSLRSAEPSKVELLHHLNLRNNFLFDLYPEETLLFYRELESKRLNLRENFKDSNLIDLLASNLVSFKEKMSENFRPDCIERSEATRYLGTVENIVLRQDSQNLKLRTEDFNSCLLRLQERAHSFRQTLSSLWEPGDNIRDLDQEILLEVRKSLGETIGDSEAMRTFEKQRIIGLFWNLLTGHDMGLKFDLSAYKIRQDWDKKAFKIWSDLAFLRFKLEVLEREFKAMGCLCSFGQVKGRDEDGSPRDYFELEIREGELFYESLWKQGLSMFKMPLLRELEEIDRSPFDGDLISRLESLNEEFLDLRIN